jgi:hypothetical protein
MKLFTPNRSNERRLNCAAMGMVLLLVTCVSPYAEALPLSRFTERVSGPMINEFGQDPNLAENIVVNRPGFFGKAETSGNNGAVLPGGSGGPSAEAILDIAGDEGGVVAAAVTYHFGVVGPPLPAPIPLLIDAVLLVEAEPHGVIVTDTAIINVFAPGVIDETRTLRGCSGLPEVCQDRRLDLVFNLGMPLGVDGTIVLDALLQARGAGEGVRIRAVADPFIQVDPTFEFADLYQIILSSNVSNTPPSQAVPEGSTLSLLSVGLVALTFLRRSKWGFRRPPRLPKWIGNSGEKRGQGALNVKVRSV